MGFVGTVGCIGLEQTTCHHVPFVILQRLWVYMAFPDLCVEVGVTCYLGFLLLGDRLLLCSPDWP